MRLNGSNGQNGHNGDGTRAVHAGLPERREGQPLLPGPWLASLTNLRGEPNGAPYAYGRYGNPTWTRYEQALGELEGGEAVVFASGMAAISAVFLTSVRPGDVLVLPSDGYSTTRALATGYLADTGVEVRLAPTAGNGARDALEGAKLVWLESPSNPGLDVCDLAELSALAHAEGALVGVDNTFATPLGQRPLALGADFSLSSDTKHIAGHSDLVLGHVAVSDPERAQVLRDWRTHTGSIAGPFETWLAHRSLATLDLRLERACATAMRLAEELVNRSDLLSVRYPGLPSDPSHELASRQMSRFGTVVSFVLESRERAQRFLGACELVAEATSFGGVHSTAERRGRWDPDDVEAGFIRFSVGCEDAEDVLADVMHALDVSAPSRAGY